MGERVREGRKDGSENPRTWFWSQEDLLTKCTPQTHACGLWVISGYTKCSDRKSRMWDEIIIGQCLSFCMLQITWLFLCLIRPAKPTGHRHAHFCCSWIKVNRCGDCRQVLNDKSSMHDVKCLISGCNLYFWVTNSCKTQNLPGNICTIIYQRNCFYGFIWKRWSFKTSFLSCYFEF